MSIYKVLRKAEQFGIRFGVCDSKDAGVGSCDQFLADLSLRDCSVYTQRAYTLGLAHFFSWLRASGGDPDQATRQAIGSYITEFARGAKQGAVGARGTQLRRDSGMQF
jgi:site-specific recombinase XerD